MSTLFCPHAGALISQLSPPRPSQQVHKEECTQCFDDQDRPTGIAVCLHCFNGGCISNEEGHTHGNLHAERTGHILGLVIKRTRKPGKQRDDQEPPMKKLAIVVQSEEDTYSYSREIICFQCNGDVKLSSDDTKQLEPIVQGVMRSMSSAQQSEVKAWEEEITACEHTLCLEQDSLIESGKISPTCSSCELSSNLWLCMTCGLVNCGRQQFGGIGGNGHALQHYEETGHMVGVKLGTITPEGGGDIYCYACNDARLDPELANHLKTFGIEMMGQTKTEKSMTELQIEHNLKFDFSMTGDDGQEMKPLFGPGLTGLKNLGNSCYMASVLQCLFALPAFARRYTTTAEEHYRTCPIPLPADCLECQMHKVGMGLLSGRYSVPAMAPVAPTSTMGQTTESTQRFQEGLRPAMFKALVGKGHEEFATMRQQDSEEFLQHLLKTLRQDAHRRLGAGNEGAEAAATFSFATEQRLSCTECGGVSYKVDQADSLSLPVPAKEKEVTLAENGTTPAKEYEGVALQHCLDLAMAPEALQYSCPSCKKSVVAQKQNSLKTFPETLILHMKKFQLVNWMPTKLEIPVDVDDIIVMDRFLGQGLQAGEKELKDSPAEPQVPEFNAAAMAQLEGMGFPIVRCQKALLATGNADAESAMNWLFEHMEDADIDAPLNLGAAAPKPQAAEITAESQSMLMDMGFTSAQATKALRETDNNTERAIEWLFSHPDDMGQEDPSASSDADSPATNLTYPGDVNVPARYRLKAFISHKGPSVHSGHYVATVRQEDDKWVLFNDEKVALAEGEANQRMKSLAYLYIYERVR